MKTYLKAILTGSISSFFNYLSKVTLYKMAIQSVIVILTLTGIASVYITATHFELILNRIKNPVEMEKYLQKDIRSGIKIQRILGSLITSSSNISRAYVFKFHDGLIGISNLPFMFQSNTHEIVDYGISSEIQNLQSIPLSINLEKITSYIEKKCYNYIVQDIPKNRDLLSFNELLATQGILQSISCPLYDKSNILIGFVGIDYNYIKPKKKKVNSIKTNLQKIAEQIRAVL